MDKYRLDSHKLLYHVDRVADWQHGANVAPIYVEMSPAGACNHRCRFCGKDYMGYQNRSLSWDMLQKRLVEMGRAGVKSIMHAGEGEPLLNKHMLDIVKLGKECGIDQAVNTNGVLLNEERARVLFQYCEWIRISLDAATADVHANLHVTKETDFPRIIDNLRKAVKLRNEMGSNCVIGIQMILLPENKHQPLELAALAKDIGVDYLVIKPYSQQPHSITHEYENVSYEDDLKLAEELAKFNTHNFSVIFRVNAMQKWDDASRNYCKCNAMAFFTYIDAGGNVWGCNEHLDDERFALGNLYESSFDDIWNGEKRAKMMAWSQDGLDISECRINCRMDEVNRYLWEVKEPPRHVNFI
jgi:MoaA/NifB/PqqE/SkfB family radical SAM enzyme